MQQQLHAQQGPSAVVHGAQGVQGSSWRSSRTSTLHTCIGLLIRSPSRVHDDLAGRCVDAHSRGRLLHDGSVPRCDQCLKKHSLYHPSSTSTDTSQRVQRGPAAERLCVRDWEDALRAQTWQQPMRDVLCRTECHTKHMRLPNACVPTWRAANG